MSYLPDISIKRVAKHPAVKRLYEHISRTCVQEKLCAKDAFAPYEEFCPILVDLCDFQPDDEVEEEEVELSSSEEAVLEEEQEEEEEDTDDLVESDEEEEEEEESEEEAPKPKRR